MPHYYFPNKLTTIIKYSYPSPLDLPNYNSPLLINFIKKPPNALPEITFLVIYKREKTTPNSIPLLEFRTPGTSRVVLEPNYFFIFKI